MSIQTGVSPRRSQKDLPLSLYHLLDPEVLANPYPLYHRLRTEDPVRHHLRLRFDSALQDEVTGLLSELRAQFPIRIIADPAT